MKKIYFQLTLVLKFIYSEKAAKFCEIFLLLLTTVHTVKSKGKISQNFVAFSEYMNFITKITYLGFTKIWPLMFQSFKLCPDEEMYSEFWWPPLKTVRKFLAVKFWIWFFHKEILLRIKIKTKNSENTELSTTCVLAYFYSQFSRPWFLCENI